MPRHPNIEGPESKTVQVGLYLAGIGESLEKLLVGLPYSYTKQHFRGFS